MKIDAKRQYTDKKGNKNTYVYLITDQFRIELGTLKEPLTVENVERQYLSLPSFRFKRAVNRTLSKLKQEFPEEFTQTEIQRVWEELAKKLPRLFAPGESKGAIKKYYQVWREKNPERWKAIQNRSVYANRPKINRKRRAHMEGSRGPYDAAKYVRKNFWKVMLKLHPAPYDIFSRWSQPVSLLKPDQYTLIQHLKRQKSLFRKLGWVSKEINPVKINEMRGKSKH